MHRRRLSTLCRQCRILIHRRLHRNMSPPVDCVHDCNKPPRRSVKPCIIIVSSEHRQLGTECCGHDSICDDAHFRVALHSSRRFLMQSVLIDFISARNASDASSRSDDRTPSHRLQHPSVGERACGQQRKQVATHCPRSTNAARRFKPVCQHLPLAATNLRPAPSAHSNSRQDEVNQRIVSALMSRSCSRIESEFSTSFSVCVFSASSSKQINSKLETIEFKRATQLGGEARRSNVNWTSVLQQVCD